MQCHTSCSTFPGAAVLVSYLWRWLELNEEQCGAQIIAALSCCCDIEPCRMLLQDIACFIHCWCTKLLLLFQHMRWDLQLCRLRDLNCRSVTGICISCHWSAQQQQQESQSQQQAVGKVVLTCITACNVASQSCCHAMHFTRRLACNLAQLCSVACLQQPQAVCVCLAIIAMYTCTSGGLTLCDNLCIMTAGHCLQLSFSGS